MLSFTNASNVQQPIQSQNQNQNVAQDHQNVHQQLPQHQQPSTANQTMRLRDNPTITPTPRPPRKRKTSPSNNNTDTAQQQQQPQQNTVQHVLPPPHTLVHPPPHMQPPQLPHGYSYAPADYTPGGMPSPHVSQLHSPGGDQQSDGGSNVGRPLSSSKRAEQNRKAQRAFRERRDQHVKALEARSQLLDTALASADEANRRWEECRALVDQLRVENAALRAALSQAQMLPGVSVGNVASGVVGPSAGGKINNGHAEEGSKQEGANEFQHDGEGAPDGKE